MPALFLISPWKHHRASLSFSDLQAQENPRCWIASRDWYGRMPAESQSATQFYLTPQFALTLRHKNAASLMYFSRSLCFHISRLNKIPHSDLKICRSRLGERASKKFLKPSA